jgi:RNA polymerase sigma factor (sigma-70 family)
MSVSDHGIAGGRQFPKTSWSALLALKERDSPEYQRRLQSLIQLYWKPVFCVIRYNWTKSDADAKDMTQAFFTEAVLQGNLLKSFAPERGSFRAFLRRAVTYFMCQERRDDQRKKRGGGLDFISVDAVGEARLLADSAQELGPDEVFDRAWNRVVLTRALDLLRAHLTAEGKAAAYELFDRYELDGERKTTSYAELGREFGMTAAQVKHALIHARGALRDVVAQLVQDYVDGPEDLNRELDLLFR